MERGRLTLQEDDHDPFPPGSRRYHHRQFRCRSRGIPNKLFIFFTAVASSAGSLSPATAMLEPRSGHTATLLPDGKVLIAGGMRRNQDFYKSAELYDPSTGKFQRTGEMNQRRVGHIAVLLGSGKVLIAGGWVGMGGTDSAELYDPSTGKFTLISKMTTPRGRPSATLLTNGDVLIAGGERRDNESLASAEIFHVKKLSFQSTGSMHHARISHTATLLQDGRVLVCRRLRGECGVRRRTLRSEDRDFRRNRQHEDGALQTYGRPSGRRKGADCGRFRFPRMERKSQQRRNVRSTNGQVR